MEYLFTYGLLRQEFINPFSKLVEEETKILGDGFTNGKLYEINGYPGLILDKDSDNKVYGSVSKIMNLSLLQKLDEFEGIDPQYEKPHEYCRTKIIVYLNSTKIRVWAYLYNWSVDEKKRIEGGDYKKFFFGNIFS